MTSTVFLSTLLLSIVAIIQGTWLRNLTVFGAAPDLPMIILMWLSLNNPRAEGPISGFLSGFIEDFISSAPLGFHAFTCTLTDFVSSSFHGSIQIDRVIMPILFGVGGTLLKAVSSLFLAALFGPGIFTYSVADTAFWIQCGMNGLLSPVIFLILSKLRRNLVTDGRVR
jgi:rod shape-determining protein MreD